MKSNVLYSVLGVIFNTIVPILIFPYISRVLGVETLGKYNFYSMAFGYFLLLSNFGISIYAIKEVGKVKDNKTLISEKYSQFISFNFATLSIILLIIAAITLSSQYIDDFRIILVFSFSLLSGIIGPDWYFIAIERQKYLLFRNIALKIVYIISVLLFVQKPDDLLKFIIISISCTYGTSILNYFIIRKEIDIKLSIKKSLLSLLAPLSTIFIIEVLIRYIGMVDIVMLGIMKSDIEVGYYTMAQKVIILSSSVMNITATTLLPRASFYIQTDHNQFILLTKKTINLIVLVSTLLCLLVFFEATPIIQILGGEDFLPSVEILKLLSLTMIFTPIINTVIFQYLYPLNKNKVIITSLVVGIIFNFLIGYLMIPTYGYKGTLIAYIISEFMIFLLILIKDRDNILPIIFTKETIQILCVFIFSFVTAFLLKKYIQELNFIYQSIIISIFFISCLLIIKEKTTTSILVNIKNKIRTK